MRVQINSILPAPPREVWELLQLSNTLCFVTAGWVRFGNAPYFPKVWKVGETIQTKIHLFGSKKGKPYRFTFVEINEKDMVLKTEESGAGIESWKHTMEVLPVIGRVDRCMYIDEVEVHAGLMTPSMWLYIKLYYRHRHLRWRKLLRQCKD